MIFFTYIRTCIADIDRVSVTLAWSSPQLRSTYTRSQDVQSFATAL